MLKLSSQKPLLAKSEILAVPVCEDHPFFQDPSINAVVEKALGLAEFSGKKDEELLFYEPAGFKARRVLFIGLGKWENITIESFRQFAGSAVKNAIKKNLANIDILIPEEQEDRKISLERQRLVHAFLEGAALANHVDERYKKERKKKALETIRLLLPAAEAKKYADITGPVSMVCRATHLAREWVNMPSNDKPPLVFADMVAKAARMAGLKVTLLKEKELTAKNFGALLAVAKGSVHPPCVLIMEYIPPAKAQNRIALVGKGVTFDSGGINLKPSSGMEEMKADMSGAAAVAATLLAAAELKPEKEIIGVLPLVENLPSGSAYRPGDIVHAYGGKTIEIGNTDAEGRLILADAMGYTIDMFKPDLMIDLATLTGACVVALGEKIAGLFSRDDALAEAIVKAGEDTHERCWRMPMPEDYKKLIKSDIADIRNAGTTRYGGAISAALFLSEFVDKTNWAHIDIAGPAYVKNGNAYTPSGASGFGVRLLCALLEKI